MSYWELKVLNGDQATKVTGEGPLWPENTLARTYCVYTLHPFTVNSDQSILSHPTLVRCPFLFVPQSCTIISHPFFSLVHSCFRVWRAGNGVHVKWVERTRRQRKQLVGIRTGGEANSTFQLYLPTLDQLLTREVGKLNDISLLWIYHLDTFTMLSSGMWPWNDSCYHIVLSHGGCIA